VSATVEPEGEVILEKRPPPKAVAARARMAFRERFGSEAALVAVAPGRVNLIGEHTDYSGGFVLPMAIDRVTAVAVAPGTRQDRWRIHSADLGQDAELNVSAPLAPGVRGLWVSYIAGVAAGFQELAEDPALPPLDLCIASSVPVGSGLSSSAALEVAVATALEAVFESPLEPLEKALLCQRAEHEFAGVPCGLMDQLVSVSGRAGHALLIDCRTNEVTPVRMPPKDQAVVLVIDSGVRHELGASEYAQRRGTCESAARKLGLDVLGDGFGLDLERDGDRMSDEERRCVRHVIRENQLTRKAAAALSHNDWKAFGKCMALSHASLRDDYRVSCQELDGIVTAASAVPGVFGARMTGAGFGGCAIALLDPAALNGVCERVRSIARAAFIVQPSTGARLLIL
jgi:galactokinase